MKPRGLRISGAVLIALVASSLYSAAPAGAAPQRQNDARSGRDAGNTFDDATAIKPRGRYTGRLDAGAGDEHDYFKFTLKQGDWLSLAVDIQGGSTTDPTTLLDPNGAVVDVGARVAGQGTSASTVMNKGGSLLSAPTDESTAFRLAVHRATVAGEYRLHIQTDRYEAGAYKVCFMNCEPTVEAGIDLIFGGSLRQPDARVLVVPPSHGDLGNPLGPTVVDYVNATLRGMRIWKKALMAFARDYPQFSYLREIDIHIEVFDGVKPVDPAGYDVILGYVAAGPVFRGVASDTQTSGAVHQILHTVGLGKVHYGGRVIALSLFGASPRAGQVMWDFPEVNDLEIVTAHEFGHTFGLGHTKMWHPKLGFDLMNSPAPFVYGDGSAAGDGGERTKMRCLTSLNLYGMAHLYRWIPSGEWQPSSGSVDLPPGMPYRWYC